MNRLLIPILILALLGGGAWVLMSGGSAEDPLPDPSEATTPAPTEAPQAAGALPQGEEDLEARTPSVERETAGTSSPDHASVDPSDVFLVEVLDAETKQPLPHMQLHWLDITGREYRPTSIAIEEVVSQGAALTSDAKGRVRVPGPTFGRRVSLACNEEGYYGHRYGLPTGTNEPFQFLLHRNQVIEVEVVHADGSPASGFRVSLVRDLAAERPQEKAIDRTGEDGIARLQYFRIDPERDGSVPFSISVGLASTAPPRHDLAPGAALPKRVRLQLPELGFLKVTAIQADGNPFPDGTTIMAQAKPSGTESHLGEMVGRRQYMQRKLALGFDDRPLEQGQTLFPVALGQELEIGLAYPLHRDYLTGSCEGPTEAGQTVELTLQEETARVMLQGRILLADGTPAANRSIEFVQVNHGSSAASETHTDADGIFRHPLGDGTPERRDPDPSATRKLYFAVRSEPGVAHYGVFHFPYALPPGTTDLGVATLDAPLLLGGQTVDGEGAVVPAAVVTLRGDLGEFAPFSIGWEWGFCAVRTDAQGRFRFHGDLEGDFQSVEAEKKGFRKTLVQLETGVDSHAVALSSGEPPFLRVLLPQGFPPDKLKLQISSRGGSGTHTTTMRLRLRDGKMVLQSDPGNYTINLSLGESDQLLFKAEDVLIGPEEAQDPRLDPVDLREVIIAQELTVRGSDGVVLPTYDYKVDGAYGSNQRKSGTPFHIAREGTEYVVWAEGHRSEVVELDGTPVDLKLKEVFPVRIHVRGVDALPKGTLIQLHFDSMASSERLTWDLVEDMTIETSLTHSGTYLCTAKMLELQDEEEGVIRNQHLQINGGTLEFLELDADLAPLDLDFELTMKEEEEEGS